MRRVGRAICHEEEMTMHPVTGEIVEIYLQEGAVTAKVRLEGSIITVPLLLLMNARIGDHVLIDAGIALSRVQYDRVRAKELVHS
jgi:hydrogenase maturation factor